MNERWNSESNHKIFQKEKMCRIESVAPGHHLGVLGEELEEDVGRVDRRVRAVDGGSGPYGGGGRSNPEY